jgi:ribose transport system substrate-binding protein
MKRITAVLLILLLALSLCSCSVQKKTYKVALIVKSTESDFWKSVYEGALAAGNNRNLEISFVGTKQEKDYRQQTAFIEQAIKNKCNAIVLAAGDYDLMAKPMEKAVSQGIPVVLVDSAVNSDKWLSSVSTDNYKAGRTLAEEMVKRLPPNSKIGVIGFVKNASPGIERERGFVDYINKSSTLKIVDTVYCDSNFDTAAALTRSILQEHPEITALAGLNAQSATGAARALDELNRKDVYLGSIDCTVEEADYMDRGVLRVAVLQNPYMMGYYSMEAAAKILNRQAYQRIIYTDVCVVDKSNMFTLKNEQLIFPFG